MAAESLPEITGTILPAVIIPPGKGGLSAFTRQAVDAGIPEETRRAYEREWRDFTAWCAQTARQPLPASADTITEYTTYLCYHRPVRGRGGAVIPDTFGLSPSSVRRAIGAVRYFHELAGITCPRPKHAAQALRGYEDRLAKARDPRARPRRATPVSRETLARMAAEGLDGEQDALKVRDAALLFLNYAAATRVSELVRINIEDVSADPEGVTVSVYRMKNRKHTDIRIEEKDNPLIVAAVRRWLDLLAQHGRTSGPLFPRLDRHGRIGEPHRGKGGDPAGRISEWTAENRMKLAAGAAGLEGKFTIHSGRRGFATEAYIAGSDLVAIARHGGWVDGSISLMKYIEEADGRKRNPLKEIGL